MERTSFSPPKQKRRKGRAQHSKQSQPKASGSKPQTIGATVDAGLGLGQQGVEPQTAPGKEIGACSRPDAGAKGKPGSERDLPRCVRVRVRVSGVDG